MPLIEHPALPLDFPEFFGLFTLVVTILTGLYIIYRAYWPRAREWLLAKVRR